MSIKTVVLLKILFCQLLAVLLTATVLLFLDFTAIAVGVAFLGVYFTFLIIFSEFKYPLWIMDLPFGREIGIKYFRQIFKISPPRKKDWLAMKVCQQVVSGKLDSLTKELNKLYQEENEQIQKEILPSEVETVIFDGRYLHSRVEKAKAEYKDAEWLARFFSFNTW